MLPEEQTPILVLTNIFLLILILFILRNAKSSQTRLAASNYFIGVILAFIFCVFSFWGWDWFGTRTALEWALQNKEHSSHLEPIYIYLISLNENYLFFRCVVWGTAMYLFFKSVELSKVNKQHALYFFCAIYLIWFSYARVTIAMSMIYTGYLLCTIRDDKTKLRILGLILIIVSYFFHKSSVFGITCALLSMFILKLGRNGLRLTIFIFPITAIAYFFIISNISSFLTIINSASLQHYANAGQQYLNSTYNFSGIGTFIQEVFLERVPYYIIAYYCFREFTENNLNITKEQKAILVICFVVVLFSSLFIFGVDANTKVVYGRFLRYAQIPACLALSYFHEHKRYKNNIRFTYTVAIMGTAYALLYSLYSCYIRSSTN